VLCYAGNHTTTVSTSNVELSQVLSAVLLLCHTSVIGASFTVTSRTAILLQVAAASSVAIDSVVLIAVQFTNTAAVVLCCGGCVCVC
jgi:hypothetical protein